MSSTFVPVAPVEHADTLVSEEIVLGDDATPAQHDSVYHAPIKPAEIHWSECPDTLHLPGQPIGHNCYEVNLPKGYDESYFEGKPFFHPELFGGRQGVTGDPVPYTTARDNVITILLLACFMLVFLAFTKARQFIQSQIKGLFHVARTDNVKVKTETTLELTFQLLLVGQTCLLFALVYFLHVQAQGIDTFTVGQYRVIGIFASIILGYIVVKAIAHAFTGYVFFDSKRNELWMKTFLFLLAMEGVCVFPFVMLQTYFGLSAHATLLCTVAIAIVFKMIAFWRSFVIFFGRKSLALQFFLYFCTLEIMPLATLLGILAIASNYLEVRI